jgi:prepilin-type processing-associated H-X9-DG protein/prepilin-type N-terminal cleavage/methylation domain-containing protein
VGGAFTLVELLVTVAVIAILAALLVPALRSARVFAKRSSCLSNLRQISAAFHIYANENGGLLPPYYGVGSSPEQLWMLRVQPYGIDGKVIFCPSDPNFGPGSTPRDPNDTRSHSYVYNAFDELGLPLGGSANVWDVPSTADTVLFAEKRSDQTDFALGYKAGEYPRVIEEKRHTHGSNYVFCDGHAAALRPYATLTPHNLWTLDPAD